NNRVDCDGSDGMGRSMLAQRDRLAQGRFPSGAVEATSGRQQWMLVFVAFFLLFGAWSVAAPHAGSPDEDDHVLRAYDVAGGNIWPTLAEERNKTGVSVMAPRSLIRERCWQWDPTKSVACTSDPGGDRTLERTYLVAGRYQPVYYGLVGLPLRWSPDWLGILLARFISCAVCAALLAMALTDAMRWSSHRLVAVGVLVAVTPMAVEIGSSVNPNGLEIAAGVALFSAAVPLLRRTESRVERSLLWHFGIAGTVLSASRVLGPLWVAIGIVALVLIPPNWLKIRQLLRQRAVLAWSALMGVAACGSLAWTYAFDAGNLGDFTGGRQVGLGERLRSCIEAIGIVADQMVGVTSWLDTRLPSPFYLIWQFFAAALVVWGFVLADRRGRVSLVALMAGAFGIPFIMQFAIVNKYGLITQGRYVLPVAASVPILATFLIQKHGLGRDHSLVLLRMCAVLLLPLHLICLAYTMVRWQGGIKKDGLLDTLNPLAGEWHPPLGSATPLVAATAGLLLLGWILWNEESAPTAPECPEPSELSELSEQAVQPGAPVPG
ncbi:MAG: DUF2142 domain-containing protein, partial [Micromonosporaceae bacterium]|nr:DUF2142 domain-containing protein [Micromonosporaceae bacterium]